ncbi:alpha/beta fold hydrolase [Porphyrobacter sp. SLTP]|uniref:alpha/beta fold hydrolase n=1 Tax=Porphyrobacter sp. SLTP TaxID=2683266 RepID=UPI0014121E31|nr:alpha/beta hydrolase [Porphyrobacter sp. SLTP]NBB24389.1 alpha/beta fold hydrolase [Porphyrobacter sp. SLTP]
MRIIELARHLIAALVAGLSTVAAATDLAVIHANRVGSRPYTEGFIGKGDDRIHYVATGEGPPVILVHGFPSFWYVWFDQMEAFSPCRRMIAIDAPGAGFSGRPARDANYRVARLARQLDRTIAALAPDEKVTLVGHDWGGALAWSYAQWKPQRLARLAVFSAPPYDLFLDMLSDDPAQRAASAYVPRLQALNRESIERQNVPSTLFETAYGRAISEGILTAEEGGLFRGALSDPAAIDAGIAWYRANIPPFDKMAPGSGWPRRSGPITMPVLLIEGSEDKTFAPTLAKRARAKAENLAAAMLPGVGHWTPFEDPQAANALLGAFLGLPGGRCPGS